jgi:hypothetical protein
VLAAVSDGAGGWYVGGAFSAFGGKPERRLAHVTADGAVDSRFHAAANAPVLAMARVGDALVVAGRFTTIDGSPHPYLAAIDPASGALRPFAATVDGPVRALAVVPAALYVGGSFSAVDGVSHPDLAAVDPATGAVLPFDPVGVRSVNALSDGGAALYVGGLIQRQGAPPAGLAAFDAQTGAPLPLTASIGGMVRALALTGGRLYVGGRFAAVDGVRRHDLAAIDLTTGSATPFAPRLDGPVDTLAVRDGTTYAGGAFAHASGQARAGVVAYGTSGRVTPWDARLHAGQGRPQVLSLSVGGTHVIAGGRFSSAGPLQQRLADLGVRRARLTPFAPRPRVAGSVEASFVETSAAPGQVAQLLVRPPVGAVTLQFLRSGAPVSGGARVDCGSSSGSALSISLMAPRAPSGLYLARLRAGSRLGFAPLIVRPTGPHTARVAIVLPTNTWQAYNRRDDDGDAIGDTWYACHTSSCWSAMSARGVDTSRPFLDHGLPRDSLKFLAWVDAHHLQADVLGDDDLSRARGAAALTRRYALMVFPGHTEYVTAREFDLVVRYRDLGGNLAFLSANNLFRLVEHVGTRLRLVTRFRDLGRPEAAIEGEQYIDWNHGVYPNEPYKVTDVASAPWLFVGTGLHDGSRFGSFGIEIDARGPSSPAGVHALASIPDIFGPGETAEMTYYQEPSGAKVFSAGVLNFGGSVENRPTSRLVANLWAHLSAP